MTKHRDDTHSAAAWAFGAVALVALILLLVLVW